MDRLNISKNDTHTIEKAHKILQIANLVFAVLLSLTSIILGFFFIAENDEEFSPIFFGAAILVVFIALFISLLLNVKFGMYYDIRAMRLAKGDAPAGTTVESDELPEL